MGAYGVNNAGQVVGSMAPISGGDHFAFLWTRGTGMQIIVNVNSSANAINEFGQIAGEGNLGFPEDAFRWTQTGGVQDLGNLGGSAAGRSINRLGHVVGGSFLSDFGEHPFVWTAAGGMQDMGGASAFATAIGVNDADVVCGVSIGASGSNAFTWTAAGGFHNLAGLGGPDAAAYTINNAGQIAGNARLADWTQHACFWSAAGVPTDIGALPGDQTSAAEAINASGIVVGDSEDAAGDSRAFVWTVSGGLRDLNSMISQGSGMILTAALGISDNGLIVGRGLVGTETHAFLLTPILRHVGPPITHSVSGG